jgi:hypothetical protein
MYLVSVAIPNFASGFQLFMYGQIINVSKATSATIDRPIHFVQFGGFTAHFGP